jgi:hypothetical protein
VDRSTAAPAVGVGPGARARVGVGQDKAGWIVEGRGAWGRISGDGDGEEWERWEG